MPSKFKVNDEVYVTFTRDNFYKSYHMQRGQVYVVKSVDATLQPIMYKLKDLKGAPLKNLSFYEHELRRAPPEENRVYPIEKFLKQRKYRGKKQHLVKYMFYPNKQVFMLTRGCHRQLLLLITFFISDLTSGEMKMTC